MSESQLTLQEHIARLKSSGAAACVCGRSHLTPASRIELYSGALNRLPEMLKELQIRHPFLLMDQNTKSAAGDRVMNLLDQAYIPYTFACMPAEPKLQADSVALPPMLSQVKDSDFVLGIGSGVINDICKMLGMQSGLQSGIVSTAPSMDGYASNSSAMIVDGVKTTLYNHSPVLVLCDLDVLKSAPAELRGAGIGDMAAKAISIAEWKIAHLVNQEYFCPPIAEAMLTACGKALRNAEACMLGEEIAVKELTEGLLLSGIAMSMAQVSRPASGSEHTLSHLMDMLSIARKTPHRLHGLQVGYGVRVALLAYEALTDIQDLPSDPYSVLRQFDQARWTQDMRRMFGDQADGLIRIAHSEQRNTEAALRYRAAMARAKWAEIQTILRVVLTQKQALTDALDEAYIPALQDAEALGISKEDVLDLFVHAKDLRARYIMPAMAFDLGLLPWLRHRLMEALGAAQDRKRYFDPA